MNDKESAGPGLTLDGREGCVRAKSHSDLAAPSARFDFSVAISLLKDRHYIRRAAWPPNVKIRLLSGELHYKNHDNDVLRSASIRNVMQTKGLPGNEVITSLLIGDMLAADWEVAD